LSLKTLLKRVEELELEEDALDDVVHSLKSEEASSINNEGFVSQLEYILSKWIEQDVTDLFDQLVAEKTD